VARLVIDFAPAMQPKRVIIRLFAPTKRWVAGLLALLWLVVAAQSVGHHCLSHQDAGHDCAACQVAHGTVLADGAVGIRLPLPAAEIVFQPVWAFAVFQSVDLRLSPGRGPPA
jgi:hypothetical protein